MRLTILFIVLMCAGNVSVAQNIDWIDDYILSFPQVAKGTMGASYVETTILLSNPNVDSIGITLKGQSGLESVFEASELSIAAGGTTEIKIAGEPFAIGSVVVISKQPITGSAHVIIKDSAESNEVRAQVVQTGQPLMSRAAVPVLFRHPMADNTSIAVVFDQRGPSFYQGLRLVLKDSKGREFVTTDPAYTYPHYAAYLDEIFPDLPTDFDSGLLTIQTVPSDRPLTFSALALYTLKGQVATAGLSKIDIPGEYLVELESGENTQQQAEDLARQYGFMPLGAPPQPGLLRVSMPHEVARALGRDPRVHNVVFNAQVTPASMAAE